MQVNIWDVCHRAGKPLTVEEIAAALTRGGRQLVNDALVWYKVKCEKDNPGSTAMWSTNERPPQETIDNAWLRFVLNEVRESSGSQAMTSRTPRLIITTDEGVDARNPKAVKRYSANPDKPPMVYRTTTVTSRELVPYDPDYREQTNTAHAAGMEFLAGYDQLGQNGHRSTNPELRKLCDLAARAIRVARPAEAVSEP
jgi:hypothetical protein